MTLSTSSSSQCARIRAQVSHARHPPSRNSSSAYVITRVLLEQQVKAPDSEFDLTFLHSKDQVMALSAIDILNDDILLIILSYLQQRDLCALSLTCKHFHTLSSPGIWKAVSTTWAFFISRSHENIYTNAHYVREIVIYVHNNAPQVSDILFATKNIRSLNIAYLSLLSDDPRFSRALSRLGELRKLSCHCVDDKMLPTIQSIPSPNLTSLSLGHKGAPVVLPSLISVIRSFPRLYTLIIEVLKITSAVDITSHPPFASIQQLTLDRVTEPATDLIYLCPNLASLDLGVDYTSQRDPRRSLQRWRPSPIPRLSLTVLRMQDRDTIVSLLEQRALRAAHVRFAMLWNFTEDGISLRKGEGTSRLTRVLDVLKPHSLRLEIAAMSGAEPSGPMGSLWQEVAAVAPHLRALVLFVDSLGGGGTEDGGWPRIWTPPEALEAELALLPFVCVHLELEMDSDLFYQRPGDGSEHPRLRALAAFPGKLAAAIPTLRVVGVSDEWRKLGGLRSTQWWRVERGEDGGGDASASRG
ncbi:uncharacterized protein BXZ73DRAFT_104513 [Epithele typhae]|uniref:uncharacterized protein n=1 Tax=Epithele typhae TaxID=378194 RepID=UPI0020077400|nr:uncharacterized protein BXZ73DRAFT_104513 [Epithele typhae]KAH9921224.1 hypothetical protein BXZ73DRAFT_104513 [Epithele typhae]